MFGILFNLTSFLFFVNIIAEAVSWIRVFDDKEYSYRRVFVHFKETKVGRSELFGLGSILKWVLIFGYLATIFGNVDQFYHLIVFGLYLFSTIVLLVRVASRNFEFPRVSVTTLAIFISVMFVESTMFLLIPIDPYLWMLLLNKLLFLQVLFFVWLFSIFLDFLRDAQINRAISKISSRPNLLTIAIVGSYGRGSTKEFLTRVLSEKFDVLEVDTAFSDAFGIAKVINSKLTQQKQIFIAEMDDYKKGDISEMVGIVTPKIIIVCGINEQKKSTFGNMDSIIASKFEAIEGLSRDGIVLFNGKSEYNMQLFARTSHKKFIYDLNKGDITIKNISESKFSLTFDVLIFGRKYRLSNVKLLGRANIENILPAIFIAAYVGMDFSLIKKAFSKERPLKSAMEPRINSKGVILIDDTHNANINSVLRATSYSKLYKGKKILVLEPLVELGKSSSEVHEKLGREIGNSFDYLFLTNDNYYSSIMRGVKKSKNTCMVSFTSPAKIGEFIGTNCKREDIVIFEGKQAALSLYSTQSKLIYPRKQ